MPFIVGLVFSFGWYTVIGKRNAIDDSGSLSGTILSPDGTSLFSIDGSSVNLLSVI